MRVRDTYKLSFTARFIDNLLLALFIGLILYFFDQRAALEKEQEVAANQVLADQNQEKQLQELITLINRSKSKNSKVLLQLDSLISSESWTWKRMDFYNPLIFSSPFEETPYPPCAAITQITVDLSVQGSICSLLPKHQDGFIELLDASKNWNLQQTRNGIFALQTKLARIIAIEKQVLQDIKP